MSEKKLKMFLPDNLLPENKRLRWQTLADMRTGKPLNNVYRYVCGRMEELGLEIDGDGSLFLEAEKINQNVLFCLLRRDATKIFPALQSSQLKVIVEYSIKFILEHCEKREKKERIKITFEDKELINV